MHARLSATLLLVAFLLAGPANAGLTGRQRRQILDVHNEARRRVSPRASNMVKLSWDEELASKAQAWADTCTKGHNPVTAIEGRWDWVGENMAFSTNPNADIGQQVLNWEGEKKVYTYSDNSCHPVPGKALLSSCGHYTQLVWAKSTRVGCGLRRDCDDFKTHLVCNYGPGGNWNGQKPYETGRKCKSCPDGYNGCQDGLCVRR